jgi:FdhE protein
MSSAARWDARIARARALAAEHAPAREALGFYAALAEYQKTLADPAPSAGPPVDAILDAIADFLRWLERAAPPRLSESAAALGDLDRAAWRAALDRVLESPEDGRDPDPAVAFVLEALIQPFAEQLAEPRRGEPPPDVSPARCRACGELPLVGVLREEGHGARRTLACARCLSEWDYLRVVCPWCGERAFAALPVFTAEQFDHVRIEACDRCRRYLKTIDLTKNGLAVPPVDDIATVALDLWAREQGYVRVRANLLGL